MITFKTQDSSFELPTRWGEITFNQFFALQKSDGSFLDLISILTGIYKSVWENSDDIMIREKLTPYLEFLNTEFDVQNYLLPDYFVFKDVRYKVVNDIATCTAGQKWHLEDLIKDGKTEVDLLPHALAIYFQPQITKSDYDAKKVEELLPDMMNLKLEEGWGVASFFLTNFASYLNEKVKALHTNQHLKKSEQELTDFVNSETFQRYSLFRRLLIKLLMKLYSRTMRRFTPLSFTSMKLVDIKKP
jgi:hypothetical protein